MATITVTSLSDDGSGGLTLREAIASAEAMAGADEIVFAPELRNQTIFLQDHLLFEDADGVTIRGDFEGDGEIDITISGDTNENGRFNSTLYGGVDDARRIDGADSAFLINEAGSKATFVGVEFDGGYATGPADETVDGGAVGVITNFGDLSLIDSMIDGAKAQAGGEAGRDAAVIVNRDGGSLTLSDVIIRDTYIRGGEALRTPNEGYAGGHAALIFNSGDLSVDRITTGGRFYGGPGQAVSDLSGDAVTDGGDASAFIVNEGSVLSDTVIGVRTGNSLAVAGGARGRIVDVTPPQGNTIYGEYGTPNSTTIVTNIGGGTFGGDGLLGLFADGASVTSDYSAGPPSTATTTPGGGVAWLGLGGGDVFIGTTGDDYAYGGGGNDLIRSGDGDDVLSGGRGIDSLDGGAGTDTGVLGGALADYEISVAGDQITLSGVKGADTFENVELFLFSDQERTLAQLEASVAPPEPEPEPAPAGPTDGADNLVGSSAAEEISALAGNDTITGLGGADTLNGNGGADVIAGNGGGDQIRGGGGADSLVGGIGRDSVMGNGGRDTLEGSGGRDMLEGGGGRDMLIGGGGRDSIDGGGGRDTINGGRGVDELAGGNGRDVFQFETGGNRDTITDFLQAQDRIEILSGAEEFGDLTITQIGDNVRIVFSNVQVTILDEDADDFTAADFIF